METQFAEGTLPVQVIVLVQPPVSLEDAPLREALKAVLAAPVARRVLALGGAGEDWLPAGFDLMGQRGGDYGERMAAALADAHVTAALPMLLIRADALEISADILEDAARSLVSAEADAAFGPASDGGFWLLGLRQPDWSLVAGLPAPGEGAGQAAGRLLLERLAAAGLRVALAPRLEIAGAALRF
jgi:glycosyltransferase A (GT-A) superfamily protein (DUF2064 family)